MDISSTYFFDVFRGKIITALFFSITFCVAALTIVSCGVEGAGAIRVDPGKFTLYRCDDLARRWKQLIEREKDLRALIEKANESTAGAVIGSIVYRTEYEGVLSEENLLQRVAADKKCAFTQEYQSDRTIR